MGGRDGDLSADGGAIAVVDLIGSANRETNGSFKVICVKGHGKYNGQNILW